MQNTTTASKKSKCISPDLTLRLPVPSFCSVGSSPCLGRPMQISVKSMVIFQWILMGAGSILKAVKLYCIYLLPLRLCHAGDLRCLQIFHLICARSWKNSETSISSCPWYNKLSYPSPPLPYRPGKTYIFARMVDF